MEKKAHVAFGNAVALSVLRPTTIEGLLITVGVSTLSSVLPDVDLKNSDIDKIFDKLMIVVCTFFITCFGLDKIFNLGLVEIVKNYNALPKYLVSIVLFIVLSFVSSKTPHRSFTHSIMGVIIFSLIVKFGFDNNVLFPFIIGMISHVFLDIFNMTGLELFYPIQNRKCLKLIDANGFGNRLILFISCLADIFIVLILLAQIIF